MEYTKMQDTDWKYPLPSKACASGHLKVSDNPPHEIYWHEYGNPAGKPVLFIHGGPGGGSNKRYASFFNPEHYRIIMYDQRGCGESRPHIKDDIKAGLANNDTAHLIDDIEALRVHLGLQSPKEETNPAKTFSKKMYVFGGSWGSTLAMAYAQAHPRNVEPGGLVLRGIFYCDKDDLNYFYQGNAARYDDTKPLDQQDLSKVGSYRAYVSDGEYTIPKHLRDPRMAEAYAKAWHDYVTIIPKAERGDMIAAYHKRLNSESLSAEEKLTFAKAWSLWEGVTSFLCHDTSVEAMARYYDPKFATAFATIENEYFYRSLRGKDPALTHLLDHDNIGRIAPLRPKIIHGMHDQVCALFNARKLKHALEAQGATFEYKETATAGHAMTEKTTNAVLTAYMDDMPPMKKPAQGPIEHAQRDDKVRIR